MGHDPTEAPRTVFTHLRDDAPLPAGLDAGDPPDAHPTLTMLRARLGPGLDPSALKAAYLDLRSGSPSLDGAAARRIVERMQRALRSDRDVLVSVGADGSLGIDAPRRLGPLRAGDPAWAWMRLCNDADEPRTVRLELEGRTRHLRLPAGSSRSFLHRLASERPGSLLVQASMPGTDVRRRIAVDVEPARQLVLRLVDGPARLVVSDALGPVVPVGTTARRDLHGRWYVHVARHASMRVVGRVRIEASRGPELEPFRAELAPGEAAERLTIRLARVADLARDGWLGGDLHAHLHYGGEYLLDAAAASLAQRAEGLWFLDLLVANQESAVVHDRAAFTPTPLLRGGAVTAWGEEFRNDFYGHVTLAGLDRLVEPVLSGFAGTDHAADFPSTVDTARRSRALGALVSAAHPVIAGDGIEAIFRVPRSVEAKELPVLAALGLVDAIDVMSYPGDSLRTARLWYRFLDCGLRVAASAGSDAFMNVADGAAFMSGEPSIPPGAGGRFSSPVGGMRVYARAERPDAAAFREAIRAGRTFVTNGPLLACEVDGAGPGAVLARRRGARLDVDARLVSRVEVDRLELIVNGRVLRRAQLAPAIREHGVTWQVLLREPAWLALRATGPAQPDVMDDYAFAHTSAVYVDVDGAGVRRRASFDFLVRWIDRLADEVTRHCRFDDAEQERAVRAAYAEARAFYAAGAAAA